MNRTIAFLLSLCLAFVLTSALPAATAAKKSSSRKTAQKKATPKTRNSSRSRAVQQGPSRTRMKEIQTALKERGYNPGPVDGQWGSRSSAALKQFEKDHQLPADGKLDSLALITLGMGPKRLAPTATADRLPDQRNQQR